MADEAVLAWLKDRQAEIEGNVKAILRGSAQMEDRILYDCDPDGNEERPYLDEVVIGDPDLHIERMTLRRYWMRVGERVFWFSISKGMLRLTEENGVDPTTTVTYAKAAELASRSVQAIRQAAYRRVLERATARDEQGHKRPGVTLESLRWMYPDEFTEEP